LRFSINSVGFLRREIIPSQNLYLKQRKPNTFPYFERSRTSAPVVRRSTYGAVRSLRLRNS
jgi:hypothetical protein